MIRCFGPLALALMCFATCAQAQDQAASEREYTTILGDWAGTYVCSQGLTRMTLRLSTYNRKTGEISAYSAFYAHEENPEVPSGCYKLTGKYSAETGVFDLAPAGWVTQPPGFTATYIGGEIDLSDQSISGTIEHPRCTTFALAYVGSDSTVDELCYEAGPVSLLDGAEGSVVDK